MVVCSIILVVCISSAMLCIDFESGKLMAISIPIVIATVDKLRFFPVLLVGKNPNAKNIIIPMRTMAKRFVRNNTKLPCAISIFQNINPIHVTQSGGNRAIAIATPAILS